MLDAKLVSNFGLIQSVEILFYSQILTYFCLLFIINSVNN